jgi:Domain of unknown function (DUF4337)
LQGEALSLQTEANIKSTEAANKWAYYQSKNMFSLEAEITLDLLSVVPVREDRKKELDEISKGYEDNVQKYSGDKNFRTRRNKSTREGKLAEEKRKAEELEAKAREKVTEAQEKIEESHLAHLKADRFDYGELFLQFAVVLCSLAILTRNRIFWLGGIGSAAVGAGAAISAVFIAAHH